MRQEAPGFYYYYYSIMTTMRYGLDTAWLNVARQQRLDDVHARCLRRILKIPSSYISRVPNEAVFHRAACSRCSYAILRRQLELFGKIASGIVDALRQALLEEASTHIIPLPRPRRRGRPCHTWPERARAHAVQAAGGQQLLKRELIHEYAEARWKQQ